MKNPQMLFGKEWPGWRRGKVSFARAATTAATCTVVAFVISDLVFFVYSTQFERWRQGFTEYAFEPPSIAYWEIVACFVCSFVALYSGRWVAPLLIGLSLFPFWGPLGGVYSGPGYLHHAVEPLVSCRIMLEFIAYVGVGIFTILQVDKLNERVSVFRKNGSPLENESDEDFQGAAK